MIRCNFKQIEGGKLGVNWSTVMDLEQLRKYAHFNSREKESLQMMDLGEETL
jgi:hypothetical protein